MSNIYEYTGGNNPGALNLPPQNSLQTNNYLSYLASSFANGNDYLNSSQTEKSWLNASFNDKSCLNNSLCFPPELRYQSLNEMVSKIVEDETQKSLMASANSLTFAQFRANSSTQKSQQFQPQNQLYQLNFHHQHHIPQFIPQDPSVKSEASKNESHSKSSNQMIEKSQDVSQFNFILDQGNFIQMSPLQFQPVIHQNQINFKKQISQDQVQSVEHTIVPQQNQANSANINRMPLAFPSSFSHQLATLSLDQQNYLLQQQRALVLHLAATEQYAQDVQNMQSGQNQYFTPNFKFSPQHQQLNRNLSNQSYNYSQPVSSPITPTLKSQLSSSSSSHSSNYSPNFISQVENENKHLQNNKQFYGPQQTNAMIHPAFFNDINGSFMQMNLNNDKVKYFLRQQNHQHQQQQQQQQQPTYRNHRRTGPANELHVRLEECLYQFKCLENERKKIETELSYINLNLNRKHSNLFIHVSNYQVNTMQRLPPNPSRVDRLIFESFKEHSRLISLIAKIENLQNTIFFSNIQKTLEKWFLGIQNVQAKRKDELINNVNRQRVNSGPQSNSPGQNVPRSNFDEKDISILASSIHELSMLTSKMRTSLWCALQISNVNYNLKPGDSLFNSAEKTKEFIEKTFEIKTDLVI